MQNGALPGKWGRVITLFINHPMDMFEVREAEISVNGTWLLVINIEALILNVFLFFLRKNGINSSSSFKTKAQEE